MNEKHYFLNSHGLIYRKLTALFLSLILVVVLSIYLIGCSGSGSSGSSQGGYSTNSGTPIATLNQVDKPVLDVSSEGQVAWAQMAGHQCSIYTYRDPSASRLGRATPTLVASAPYCTEITTNNAGQIAWIEPAGEDWQVWLYSNGTKEKIVNKQVDCFGLDINGSGQLVWTEADDARQCQIYRYVDGTTTQLTDTDQNLLPRMNDRGETTWQGVSGENLSIYLGNEEGQVAKIAENSLYAFDSSWHGLHWFGGLNSLGSVVWIERVGEVAQIFIYRDGQATQITSAQEDCSSPDINGLDQVVWAGRDGEGSDIFLYDDGAITRITDGDLYASDPRINDRGQIVWEAFDGNDPEIFIYDKGAIVQLTDNEIYDESPRISDAGQVFWVTAELVEDFWRYTNIMTTRPGQEPRAVRSASSRETGSKKEQLPLLPAGEGPSTNFVVPSIGDPEDPDKITFLVFGDTRGANGSWAPWSPNRKSINTKFLDYLKTALVNGTIKPKPQLVFYGGDISTYANDYAFKNLKNDFNEYIINKGFVPLMVMGNHERYVHFPPGGIFIAANQERWRDYFQDRAPANNGPNPPWNYRGLACYFSYGHSFFVICDSYYLPRGKFVDQVDDAHVNWVNSFPALGEYKHKFAFSHAPVFSVMNEKRRKNNEAIWGAMAERNFDIFFGSHEHLYSHRVIPANFGKFYHFPKPMLQVISGCATEDFEDAKVKDKKLWHIGRGMHFVLVEVDGNTVRGTHYAVPGNYSGAPIPYYRFTVP